MAEVVNSQLSEKDKILLDQAKDEIEKRLRLFWQRHKITDDEIAKATLAYQEFLKEEPNSFTSKTPIAYRMFVLGWSKRNEGRASRRDTDVARARVCS